MTPLCILTAAGEAMFGEDWREPMGELISVTNPVDSRRVRRWADGTKPLDDWVIEWIATVLPRILEFEAYDLEREAYDLKRRAKEVRSIVAGIQTL